TISWDPSKLNITGQDAADELGSTRTKPRIALLAGTGGRDTGGAAAPGMEAITVAAYMMQPGDDAIVADRIYELLSRKRSPIPKVTMKAPGANLVGRWDVTVEFFCATSELAARGLRGTGAA